jgi:cobalt-zinc-cadmium efflux system protein
MNHIHTHEHGQDSHVHSHIHGLLQGHGHTHVPRLRSGAQNYKRLFGAFGITFAFFLVELVTGLVTGSLALLSDAGHMLTDLLGLGLALAAIHFASRSRRDSSRTFGLYRLEILAALANGVLLFGVAGYVLVEAARRLSDPPAVPSVPMLWVAAGGLAANLIAFALLRGGSKDNLNVRGAYLEVISDALGSVAVIVAAIVIQLTGWRYADPLAGAAIGLFILPRTWRLTGQALRVLVQAAPAHLDLAAIRQALLGLEGVVDVHDLHCWTLTSDMEVASAHLKIKAGASSADVLSSAKKLLTENFSVDHATLQIEEATAQCWDCQW